MDRGSSRAAGRARTWLATVLVVTGSYQVLAGAPAETAAVETDLLENGVGLEVGLAPGQVEALITGLEDATREAAPQLVIELGREECDRPERLDEVLGAADRAGLGVVLVLSDEGWSVDELSSETWAERVTELALHVGTRAAAYQVFEVPAARFDPVTYTYLLKRAATAVRAANPAVRVVSGSIRPEDGDWLEDVFAGHVAPYLDVLAAHGPDALPAVMSLRDRFALRATVWLTEAEIDPSATGASSAAVYLEALTAGAEWVGFSAPATETPNALASLVLSLVKVRGWLPPGMAPASLAALPFEASRAVLRGASGLHTLQFLDDGRGRGLVAYRAEQPGRGSIGLPLRKPLGELDLFDPMVGGESGSLPEEQAAGRTLELPLRSDWLLLRYAWAPEASPMRETVGVSATSELTAEEIIALEQERRLAQKSRLDHYEAHATIALHYRIVMLAESVDVVTENRLYVRDGNQDYEQLELLVQGTRWQGRRPPALPFIQPERVEEVPLDIALYEGYVYELLGREKVLDRDCYLIGFAPSEEGRSLYRGKVAIDAQLFTRVRMEAVQTALEPPLHASQVVYTFEPIEGEGGPYWLPTNVSGQMVFEVLGHNLVVEREASYRDFAVNLPGFPDRAAEAYASGRPVFRESEEGYFDLDEEGLETERTDLNTLRNTFLAFGGTFGLDGDVGTPFVGINYFDFDFLGSGTQMDIAWAGPVLAANWTDPTLRANQGGRPWVLSLQGVLNAIPRRLKVAGEPGAPGGQTLEARNESFRVGLAIPTGNLLKWSVEGWATHRQFSEHGSTDPNFVLPTSTVEGGVVGRVDFSRKGYLAAGWAEIASRAKWEPWGLAGQPFDPGDQDFARFGLQAAKSFHLTPTRNFGLELAGYEGSGLDRFSRFELGEFGTARVRGFNSAGIHFDRGLVAGASHSFPLAMLRLEVDLDAAWVASPEDFGPGFERFVGGGFKVDFPGPWSTLGSVRINHGFDSSVPGIGGGTGDLRVVFFKTFDHWWPWTRSSSGQAR